MISDRIADDERPQMKILNMPILMHSAFLSQIESFQCLFKPRKFLTLSNQISRYKIASALEKGYHSP